MSELETNIARAEAYVARFREGAVLNRVGGEDRPAISGASFDNHSPVDEEFLCKVARSGPEDIDAAAQAAHDAFPAWRDISGKERRGWCKTDENQSLVGQDGCPLCRAKTAPLGESGGAVELEVIEDRGVSGDEFLQTSQAPKPLHGAFSSSEWQVRVFNSVVEPTAACLQIIAADLPKCDLVGRETIGNHNFRPPISAHQFPEPFQFGAFVAPFGDDTLKHLAFVICGPPEIVQFTADFHEHLVDAPLPFRKGA